MHSLRSVVGRSIWRAVVARSRLSDPTSMILHGESGSLRLAARSLLENLERISSAVGAANRCKRMVQRAELRICDCVADIPKLGSEAVRRSKPARRIIDNYGNFSVAFVLYAITPVG
jgi:hypothetical protein